MKTIELAAILLFTCFLSLNAQDSLKTEILSEADILGKWNIFQITYITREGVKKMTENQMNTQNAFAEYYFMESGKFKQVTNMTEDRETLTQLGTWKIKDDQLIIRLKIDNEMKELGWSMDFKYGVLNLTRSSPDDALKIINSFRKE